MEYTDKQRHKKRLREAGERLKRSLAIISNASHFFDTDNHNVLNACTSTEQNISSSSNASDILLHKSSNDLTNIDFAKEDEHKLITDFAAFEKHTNISLQSCTTNIFLSDHGTIEETFKSALTE